ncbi:RICIN domain-containing protein [Hymenobacter coccineus]|uniref:Ricin B lectin domain-containing protein n=1 Tax=Hymenobacter coccineus TaxID=1908235 RepID=A0A1G1STZ8_9BACT|nr:RICIN domain-containing protein [Hymenobacter coccineus]OGX82095.1 hypothetical protein BEN49_02780 [Hymenobacter coccineus]
MKKLILLLPLLNVCCSFLARAQITRVVCVGNSVTAGYTLQSDQEAWPARLGVMLGSKYTVYNCGVSGTTMLKRTNTPYWNTMRFTEAKSYDPNILIISLGTNDAHPDNWQYKADFVNDYSAMIDAFRQNGRNPTIYLCYPVACYGDASQVSNLQNEVIPLIAQVAKAKGANIIDYNTPTQGKRGTLYNDNLHPNAAGALLLAETAFNTLNPVLPAFYQSCSYGGYGVKLTLGDYNYAALQALGVANDDISSIKVPAGYKVFAYVEDNFGGNYLTLTADNACLGGWDNLTTSIRVRANGVTGKNGTYSLQNRNSGKYMDVAGGSTADGANILQWRGTGAANQQFALTDVGDGAYKISNVATGKVVDVAGGSVNNTANVLQWTAAAGGANNQKFILLAADNGYYKLKAAHSGRLVEVSGGGLNDDDNIDQYDDNNQLHGQWLLAAASASLASKAATAAKLGPPEAVLFPNPATETVTLTDIPANTTLTVVDAVGRTVLHLKSPASGGAVQVNVSSLKAGSYYLRTGKGESKALKILKQ